MGLIQSTLRTPSRRIAVLAVLWFGFDQLTKLLVLRMLGQGDEKIVLDGFFKFVHWSNTGASFSMFSGNNEMLAIIALVALVVLIFSRHHFDTRTWLGQIAFGLIFGGITGNVFDRLLKGRHHVIDFIRFYMKQRGGDEIGFPAFNIADSGICIGVALIFWITWKSDRPEPKAAEPSPQG